MEGKAKLLEILNKREYFRHGNFYVAFGSYDDIDCGFLTINDKLSLNIVEKDGDISILGGDEISGGCWYDLDDEDTEYMNECLDKVYKILERECV